jgi:hypothetical protein
MDKGGYHSTKIKALEWCHNILCLQVVILDDLFGASLGFIGKVLLRFKNMRYVSRQS